MAEQSRPPRRERGISSALQEEEISLETGPTETSWRPVPALGDCLSKIFKGEADLSPLELCTRGDSVSFYVLCNKEHTNFLSRSNNNYYDFC